mgnify:CR=1 FL=1
MKRQGQINQLLAEIKRRGGMTHTEMKNFLVKTFWFATPEKYPSAFNSKGNYRHSFSECGMKYAKLFCRKVATFKGVRQVGFKYVIYENVDPTTIKPYGKETKERWDKLVNSRCEGHRKRVIL